MEKSERDVLTSCENLDTRGAAVDVNAVRDEVVFEVVAGRWPIVDDFGRMVACR